MVALVRELIADKTGHIGQPLILGRVDAAYLATVENQAAQADETDLLVKGPKTSVLVSQGELDVQDGICLTMKDEIWALFQAARAINTKIPALLSNTTRRYFGIRETVRESPAAPPPRRPSERGAGVIRRGGRRFGQHGRRFHQYSRYLC